MFRNILCTKVEFHHKKGPCQDGSTITSGQLGSVWKVSNFQPLFTSCFQKTYKRPPTCERQVTMRCTVLGHLTASCCDCANGMQGSAVLDMDGEWMIAHAGNDLQGVALRAFNQGWLHTIGSLPCMQCWNSNSSSLACTRTNVDKLYEDIFVMCPLPCFFPVHISHT